MQQVTITLSENVKLDSKLKEGKPIIIVETDGVIIELPANLVQKMDLEIRRSDNIRGCACGYCGTSCSNNGTCYCGECYFDC